MDIRQEKITGALLGAAVGDALAFPFSGLSPVFTGALGRDAMIAYKPHRSGAYPPGQVTALTQMTVAVTAGIAEECPEDIPERVGRFLFPLARDRLLVAAPRELLTGVQAWARGRCAPRRVADLAPVHLLPLALRGEEQQRELLAVCAECAGITGQDSGELLAIGAAFLGSVCYSGAVEEIVLGSLLDAAEGYARNYSSAVADYFRAVPDALFLAERDGVCPLAEWGLPVSVFQVMSGILGFLKSPYDCERSLLIAQRSGGGCVAAFVCGALAGVFNGEESLPRELVANISARESLVGSASLLGMAHAEE